MLTRQPFAEMLDQDRRLFQTVTIQLHEDPHPWHALWVHLLCTLAQMGINSMIRPHRLPLALTSRYCLALHLQIMEHLANLSASAMMVPPGASLSCYAVECFKNTEQGLYPSNPLARHSHQTELPQ